jgi:hypothetical protein
MNTKPQPPDTKIYSPDTKSTRVPDETGMVSITAFVKIFDRNTKQVYLEKRT